jgi:transposase
MPKKTTIKIKESIEILRKRLSESKGKLSSDKIKTLLYIKERKFHFQSDIGKDLGRTEKTIRDWIKEYSINGYRDLLKDKRGGNNTRTISNKAVKHASKVSNGISLLKDMSLEKDRVSFDLDLSSFIELKLLFEKKLGEKIEYHALYSHFRRNHKVEFNFLKDLFLEKRKAKKR